MFSSIPFNRLLLYFMALGLLPIFFAWLYVSSQLSDVNTMENHVWSIQSQAYQLEKKQAVNIAVRNHFSEADHFYIDKHLETLNFLEPEVESLKKMLANPNFPPDENAKKRFELLSGGNNMQFTEGIVQSTPTFQEVTETLVHPIEVNVQDLRQILCYIEGVDIGTCVAPPNRPQLIILDFKLDKKNVSEKNQVFLLNLKLLKREFL